jgi:hypothetical protein
LGRDDHPDLSAMLFDAVHWQLIRRLLANVGKVCCTFNCM